MEAASQKQLHKKYLDILLFAVLSIVAILYELYSADFGKQGIPLNPPTSFGQINNFEPKIFPSEMVILLLIICTAIRAKELRWPKFDMSSAMIGVLFLIASAHIAVELKENPLLVIRNSAFVWYLIIPILLAMYPISAKNMDRVWSYFLTAVFWVLAIRFGLCILFADYAYFNWCVDVGVFFILAYGLYVASEKKSRFALLTLGAAYGTEFFGKVQRTIFLGLVLFSILLPVWHFYSKRKLPQLRRVVIFILAIPLGMMLFFGARTIREAWGEAFNYGFRDTTNQSGSSNPFISNPFIKSETTHGVVDTFRLYMWVQAWDEFRNAPLTGIGFKKQVVKSVYRGSGHSVDNDGSFEHKGMPPVSGPHNSYLNALARLGIFGFICLLGLHLIAAVQLLKHQYWASLFILLGQMLYATFNVGLEGPIRSFPILLVLGVSFKLAWEEKSTNEQSL